MISYALIKKNEFYKCTFIIKLYQILFYNNIVIFDYNISNFKIYLILNYNSFNSIVLNDIK